MPSLKTWSTDRAQDTVEYLMVTGAVVVVIALGLLAYDQLVPQVLAYVCPGADTANGAAAIGACIP